MKTRKQYMNKEISFHDYYSQFVTPFVLTWVRQRIGIDRLLASTDPHLNDIPLRAWDRFHGSFLSSKSGRLCADANGGGVSLSDAVCTAKTAAQQLIASHGAS